ncbi:hypothetical protein SIM91_44485 [Rhodococcus opacus]|nr:hypothetical protein [Rhodococcus opacus]
MTMLPRSVLASVTTEPLVEAVTDAAARPSSSPQAVSGRERPPEVLRRRLRDGPACVAAGTSLVRSFRVRWRAVDVEPRAPYLKTSTYQRPPIFWVVTVGAAGNGLCDELLQLRSRQH